MLCPFSKYRRQYFTANKVGIGAKRSLKTIKFESLFVPPPSVIEFQFDEAYPAQTHTRREWNDSKTKTSRIFHALGALKGVIFQPFYAATVKLSAIFNWPIRLSVPET